MRASPGRSTRTSVTGWMRPADGVDREDPYIGNYGDNSLLYFHQYQNAAPGSSAGEKARPAPNINAPGHVIRRAVRRLAQGRAQPAAAGVWIVAPEATLSTELAGQPWRLVRVSGARRPHLEPRGLEQDRAVRDLRRERRLLRPCGSSDAAADRRTGEVDRGDASNEIFRGNADNPAGPYGLGVRVPMVVMSPWSKGGWVYSEVFDHTSMIRFLERRFAQRHPELIESNITQWRRTVCGDLTAAFDFKTPNTATVELPDVSSFLPKDHQRYPDYVPAPPAEQSLPQTRAGATPGACSALQPGRRGPCLQRRRTAAQVPEPWEARRVLPGSFRAER